MTEAIEFLLVVGLTGLLYLLRLDAQRFGVAEYDDSDRNGDWRSLLRRISWYGVGLALLLMVYWLYPQPVSVLHLDMGTRSGARPHLRPRRRRGRHRARVPVRVVPIRRLPPARARRLSGCAAQQRRHRGHRRSTVPWRAAGPAAPPGAERAGRDRHPGGPLWRGDTPVDQGSEQGDAVHRPAHRDRWRLAGGRDAGHRSRGHRSCHHPLRGVPGHRPQRSGATRRLGAGGGRRPRAAAQGLGPRGWQRSRGMDGAALGSARARALVRRPVTVRATGIWRGTGLPGSRRLGGAAAGHEQRAHERTGSVSRDALGTRPGSATTTRLGRGCGARPLGRPILGSLGGRPHHGRVDAGPAAGGLAAAGSAAAGSASRGLGASAHRLGRSTTRLQLRPRPPVGLYLHIPFCVSLCPYCDFVVVTGRAAVGPASRVAELVAALHVELDLRADTVDAVFGDAAAARERVSRRRHAVAPLGRPGREASSTTSIAASASPRAPRSPSRRTRAHGSWGTWPASGPRA